MYLLVLKDSGLVYPGSAPSVHLGRTVLQVYSFKCCFPIIVLNKIGLKYGAMKLTFSEKFKFIIELGAIYLFGLKVSFLVRFDSAL